MKKLLLAILGISFLGASLSFAAAESERISKELAMERLAGPLTPKEQREEFEKWLDSVVDDQGMVDRKETIAKIRELKLAARRRPAQAAPVAPAAAEVETKEEQAEQEAKEGMGETKPVKSTMSSGMLYQGYEGGRCASCGYESNGSSSDESGDEGGGDYGYASSSGDESD